MTDGSIVRLKPEFEKHVWSYEFMQDRTDNGVPFQILNVIDEYTRECLAVRVERKLTHKDVIEELYELFVNGVFPFKFVQITALNSQRREYEIG